MIYLIPIAILLIALVLFSRHNVKARQKKQSERIDQEWGNPKTEFFNFHQITKYASLPDNKAFHKLTEQTIFDIDFYQLFRFIDRTTSRVGQQLLFKKVSQPGNDLTALHNLNESADYFTSNPVARKEMQIQLTALGSTDAYAISSLLQDRPMRRPPWFNLTIIGMTMAVGFTLLAFFYPVFLILLIFPAFINVFIHYWNKENVFLYVLSFPQLNILINVCHNVSKNHIRFANSAVTKSLSNLKSFQQRIGFLNFSNDNGIKGELSALGGYVTELLKAIFLIEVFALFYLIDEVESQRESIAFLFNYVGEIDVAISIASLRAGSLKTCKPVIGPAEKKFSAVNLYHPLLTDGVKNDMVINSRSILITGSNMSGKTTFLRTILLNSVLGQTIYTCFADNIAMPVLRQFSSMRIDDNLQEGKSYYFEEVNVMGNFVNESTSSNQNIFVLDEVFKGTNTVERIAAAKAILSYLNRGNNIVIVSTHDVELSHMLEREYELYHFSETVENNALHFDYKLKPGRLKTRNAIRILELENYPSEIVEEARAISYFLDQNPRSTPGKPLPNV